jgi:hypothetical protein
MVPIGVRVDSESTAHAVRRLGAPMLMLVRDTDTASDVEARLAEQARTVAEMASAPVRHIPAAFLAAVAGLFPELLEDADVRRLAAL